MSLHKTSARHFPRSTAIARREQRNLNSPLIEGIRNYRMLRARQLRANRAAGFMCVNCGENRFLRDMACGKCGRFACIRLGGERAPLEACA
jgi:predicted RNA-binding Zn-ribbon protein involved in translation (DUF1610 family)